MSLLAQQVACLLKPLSPKVGSGRIHRSEDDQEKIYTCTKCGELKAYDDFYYNHSKKERQYECKACVCAAKRMKNANKEKAK